jgi:hypothetical protein
LQRSNFGCHQSDVKETNAVQRVADIGHAQVFVSGRSAKVSVAPVPGVE